MSKATTNYLLRKRPNSRGATMVETSLILPVFIFLLFGAIQWGFIFVSHITLRSAAAVACRVKALEGGTNGNATTAAGQSVVPVLDPNQLTVTFSTTTVSGATVNLINLSYPLRLFIPFVVPGQVNGRLTLSTQAAIR